ncbi:hypothetical protein LAX21_29015 [Escherichia coli]|nr:hypothetical protein [Escherichia coli]
MSISKIIGGCGPTAQ